MLKERPILFNGDMVRALLDGRKTQTRRVLKSQPPEGCGLIEVGTFAPIVIDRKGEQQPGPDTFGAFSEDGEWGLKCPYGQPSDQLWVKETWRCQSVLSPWDLEVTYAADGVQRIIKDGEFGDKDWNMPKAAAKGNVSPLFMPRWASRITLEIVSVRVERLQDISNEDAVSEGVGTPIDMRYAALDGFKPLWESINGTGAWAENPWVWIVEFKRVENAHA